ncbi:MAG: FAD-dependent oxidoreductase [Chloroflexota bacterium]
MNTRDLRNIVDWQVEQLRKLGVEVHVETEVTAELVEKEKPDVVILATGSRPRVPQAPGADEGRFLLLDDYLGGKRDVGRRIVVVGGGYGLETAVSLGREGKEVTVVEESAAVGQAPYLSARRVGILSGYAREGKVRVLTQTRVIGMDRSGVLVADKDGKETHIEADTVIVALDRVPENTLVEQLRGKVPEVYEVGDCVEPLHIMNAVHSANRVARLI